MNKPRSRQVSLLVAACMVGMLMVALGGCGSAPVVFAPRQPLPPSQFSHDLWDQILKNHVGEGRVDYTGIRDMDLEKLNTYLDLIARTDPNSFASEQDKLAFWINAYNAFAVKGVLEGYSPASWWGRFMFFFRAKYVVGGKELNLWTIKNQILRQRFEDPRIHFALVSASRGCPNLNERAYVGSSLDEMLEQATRDFINDERHNRIDRSRGRLYLSRIFKWYAVDFSRERGTVKTYFLGYLDVPVEEKKPLRAYDLRYLKFDWNLNGPPLERKP